jgi:hypothetical protein
LARAPTGKRGQGAGTKPDKGTDKRIRWSFGLQCELG